MDDSWKRYRSAPYYDELITAKGHPRTAARGAVNLLRNLPDEELAARRAAASAASISFCVASPLDGRRMTSGLESMRR